MPLVKECADILITTITKIVNYSITEGSFPNCFKMALLDLSVAFDTIDHSLLYDCLHDRFGLDGTVLLWKLYLSKIKIDDSFSEGVILPFGVPQG